MTHAIKHDRPRAHPMRVKRGSLLYRLAARIAATHGYMTAPAIRLFVADARLMLAEMERPDDGAWSRANDQAWINNRETVDHTPEEVWPLMLEEIAKGIEI